MKRLPRMGLAIRPPLQPPDRLRSFRVDRNARRVEVDLPVEPFLPTVRTGAPERLPDAGFLNPATPCRGRTRGAPACARGAKRNPPAAARRVPQPAGWKRRGKRQAALPRAQDTQTQPGRWELHRLAEPIVKRHEFVADETLQGPKLVRKGTNPRGLNRAIAAEARRETLDTPACRAASGGISFVELLPAGASQDRARPGTRVREALPEPIHRCGDCRRRAGARRDRGPARAVLRSAHLRGSRGSGRDGAGRPRGFRSMLNRRSRRPLAAQPRGADGRSRKRNRHVGAHPKRARIWQILQTVTTANQ